MAIDTISKHRVYVTDRGGQRRILQLKNISSVKWDRIRDGISEATVKISAKHTDAQSELLNTIEPGRHELVIYRGRDRVWEGPITLMTFDGSGLEIDAKDVMYYVYRTVMHNGYDSSYVPVTREHGDYVTARALTILQTELARKEALNPPINVVPYIVEHHYASDGHTTRVTVPYQATAFEHIDDMAAKSGMDYTVVGRAIHLWDTNKNAVGQTATVTESDFLGNVYVSVYGSELATRAVVTDGKGTYGVSGGIDDYYGEWEILATPYDEGATTPDQSVMHSQAERNMSGRNPTPLQVRIPDNSSLNMNGVLKITDLVPGVYVPLLAQLNLRKVSQMQKLNTMSCEETDKGETVQVSFYPASLNDDTPEDDA